MGLLTAILGFPLAPLKGVIRLGELLRDEAERRLHDPAVARRELEEIDEARAAGLLSEEDAAEAMDLVLRRMTGQPADLPEDTDRR